MPITIRTEEINVKNTDGTFMTIDAVTDKTTSQRIAEAEAAIENKKSEVMTDLEVLDSIDVGNVIADNFDASKNYSAGDYFLDDNNGTLKMYQFKADHSAGAWNANEVNEVRVGEELKRIEAASEEDVTSLKSAVKGYAASEGYIEYNDSVKAGYAATSNYPAMYRYGNIVELNGTFGSSGPYFYRISGTVSKASNVNNVASTPTIPLINGHKYRIGATIQSGTLTIPNDGAFDLRLYDSNVSHCLTISIGNEEVIEWTDTNATLLIRAANSAECTNLMLCVYIKDCTETEEVEPIKDGVRVNPIWEQGRYNSSTGAGQSSSYDIRTVYHVAISATCVITVPSGLELTWYKYGGYSYTTYETYSAGLTGVVILNNNGQYKFSLKKTNGETISPNEAASFVYETENSVFLLGPSGDTSGTTDLAQIRKVLYSLRECHLAPGDYYIGNGLSIPNDSTLHGCGRSTIIHYIDSASGSCITLGSCCSLKDFSVVGSDTDLVFIDTEVEPTEGLRNAILFTGSNPTQKKGYISNLWISNFNGSGIRCADTGYGSSSGMNLDDCYIWNCYTGLNIFKSSEFHRISNVCIVSCFKAVVNNGGNNTFANCSLNSSMYGFVMDDTDGDKNNNTHGEAVGCIMQHNRTRAIIVKGYSQSAPSMASGFMFVGCNVDDGGIECVNTGRIVMSACNFMNAFSITVTNGGLLAFIGCVFRDGTENRISIVNNNAVRFTNCYLNDGSEFAPLN